MPDVKRESTLYFEFDTHGKPRSENFIIQVLKFKICEVFVEDEHCCFGGLPQTVGGCHFLLHNSLELVQTCNTATTELEQNIKHLCSFHQELLQLHLSCIFCRIVNDPECPSI